MLVTPVRGHRRHSDRGRRRPHRSPGVQDGLALGPDRASPEDIPLHDATFDEFWRDAARRSASRSAARTASPARIPRRRARSMPQPQVAEGDEAEADEDEEGLDMPLYSPVEVLAARDFSTFVPDEMQDIARAIMLVARRLATRESRRYRSTQRGHAIDLRRTMRRNIKYGGTVVELAQEEAQDSQAEDRAHLRRQPQHGHVQQVPAAVHLRAAEHARPGRELRLLDAAHARDRLLQVERHLHRARPHRPRGAGLVGRHAHRREPARSSTPIGRCARSTSTPSC